MKIMRIITVLIFMGCIFNAVVGFKGMGGNFSSGLGWLTAGSVYILYNYQYLSK